MTETNQPDSPYADDGELQRLRAIELALRILAPGSDDDVTLGELRREYGIRVPQPGAASQ